MADDMQNFYDSGTGTLPGIEIGTALQEIDRMNPGKVRFNIPVLTPNMGTGDVAEKELRNKSKSNMLNEDAGAVEAKKIKMENVVYIEIPRELCCHPSAKYNIDGVVTIKGQGEVNVNLHGAMAGSGSVSDPGNSFSVTGTIQQTGTHRITINDGTIKGYIQADLKPENRFIPKGSKWAIGFLGGDSTKPIVLARLPDGIMG